MDKTELLIGITSDLHNTSYQIDRVKTYSKQGKLKYDFVFYLGDFDSLYEEEQLLEVNKAVVRESMEGIKQMLLLGNTISRDILYIPGNHDPLEGFENTGVGMEKYPNVVNIHKKCVEICDGLLVAGAGGAVTSIVSTEKDYHKHLEEPGACNKGYYTNSTKGFPYNQHEFLESDAMQGQDGKELQGRIREIPGCESKSLIVLTHGGPYYSATSNCIKNKGKGDQGYYTGSIELDKFINGNENVFLNVHGHNHRGIGCNKYNGHTLVVNPGSGRNGRFAILKLIKVGMKWEMKDVDIINGGREGD